MSVQAPAPIRLPGIQATVGSAVVVIACDATTSGGEALRMALRDGRDSGDLQADWCPRRSRHVLDRADAPAAITYLKSSPHHLVRQFAHHLADALDLSPTAMRTHSASMRPTPQPTKAAETPRPDPAADVRTVSLTPLPRSIPAPPASPDVPQAAGLPDNAPRQVMLWEIV